MKLKIILCGLKTSIIKRGCFLYLYIYNKYYYTLIKINKVNIIKLLGTEITLHNTNITTDTNPIKEFNRRVMGFIYQFSRTLFTKIKFTGKGYKIKKNSNNSIMLLFNRSHITTIWWKNIIIKKIKKYKIYIRYTYPNKNIVQNIVSIRSVNIFTKKGLRLSRQTILKKKGKK